MIWFNFHRLCRKSTLLTEDFNRHILIIVVNGNDLTAFFFSFAQGFTFKIAENAKMIGKADNFNWDQR